MHSLNEKEKKLYQLIKNDPYSSQQELANALGLSRPSIANMISDLIKKGFILGKAYVLNESEQVFCIGGANVDRKFHAKKKLQLGTSNPIHSEQSAGGVARNIAENLGRIGMDATLLTAAGTDTEWSFIEKASSPYMNLDYVASFIDESTGSYTAVLDANGDLTFALADMDVYERITPEFIRQHASVMSQAKCLVADLNIPQNTLEMLCEFAGNHAIPIVLVTVSAPKMDRMPTNLKHVTWLITNKEETEAYLKKALTTRADWENAVNDWLQLGISNVVVTNGNQGAMLGNHAEGIRFTASGKPKRIADVTGAGDAFSSAVIFAWLEGKSLEDIGKAGTANATKTLESTFTVRQNLTEAQLQKDMEELQ